MPAPLPSASHRVTNDVVFGLIRPHLQPDSRVLDFGAGSGHMSQRIGNVFESWGVDPATRLIPCEVTPEAFQYPKITCVQIGLDSIIPAPDASMDIVYAIEVLEHTFRPYDFLTEAWRVLKPGGLLVFSVPNSLHMASRFSFLLTGFPEMFGPPSTDVRNAGRICGHIMPLNLAYFVYGLTRAGFVNVEFHADRMKSGSRFLAIVLWPALKLASWRYQRQLKAYDEGVWREHNALVARMNSMKVLASRSCILAARKPA